MHAEKEYSIGAPLKEVWKLASDPKGISECIPGIKSFEEEDSTHFVAKVGHSFTFLKGTVTLKFEVLSMENHIAGVKIDGKSIGSAFQILTEIRLEERDDWTRLTWSAEMKSSGLLAAVPDTVAKGAAVSLADRIFDCLEKRSKSGKRC